MDNWDKGIGAGGGVSKISEGKRRRGGVFSKRWISIVKSESEGCQ